MTKIIRLLKNLLNPGWRAVILFRSTSWTYRHHLDILSVSLHGLNMILHGCDISRRAIIGPGMTIYHPVGIVVGDCESGNNLRISNGVTIGNRDKRQIEGRENPRIGNNVVIYAGAVVIGPIVIGDDVIIAPNAVVIDDVPARLVVGGIPAKPLKKRRAG